MDNGSNNNKLKHHHILLEIMEKIMELLRGSKVKYYLIDGETILINGGKYPFDKSKIPIQCRPLNNLHGYRDGYTSGSRSIVIPFKEEWFKAKAIGIPTGSSQPIYYEGEILTYYLYNARIGSGRLIWGFMTTEEAKHELEWIVKIRELNLPTIEPIGIGVYDKVRVLRLSNRIELFKFLAGKSIGRLISLFKEKSEAAKAACIFCNEPSDIRADEILYGLLIPNIKELIDIEDCKDYLKWLGSSCGYNLRLHHDNNIIHGTIKVEGGFMTNSHLANHIVTYDRTLIADYHMAREVRKRKDKKLKIEEYYCLMYVMNPLPSARAIVHSMRRRASLIDLPEIQSGITPIEAIVLWDEVLRMHAGEYTPRNVHEELTKALIEGIEYGYNRRRILEIESKLKRRMLIKLVILKSILWKILNLPKGMQRGVEYVRQVIEKERKAINWSFIKEAIEAAEEKVKKSL